MADTETKPAPKKQGTDDAPKGFDTVVGRERGDGWLSKSPGQVVMGRLIGRFTMKGQQNDDGTYRTFYQIKLGEGSRVKAIFQGDDKEKHEVYLEEGQTLNVDEHKALEDLAPYTTDGGVYDVWMKYVSEDPIPGKKNRTFWRMQGPKLKTLKPGRPHSTAPQKPDEEEIPF